MEQYLPLLFTATATYLLGLMCYQDWEARSISWPAFPALGLALLSARLSHQSAPQIGFDVLVNWVWVVALVVTLWLYVRLRFRHLRLDDCLGTGDVLYWVVAAVCFSPVGFLAYFLGSSIVALLVAGLLQLYQRPTVVATRIPLAGVQAACLLALIGLQKLVPSSAGYWADNILPII